MSDITFYEMIARLNPGTRIKCKKGHLGYLLGDKCYAVKSVLYLGKGEFRPYHKNGKLNTKAEISNMGFEPTSIDRNQVVEKTKILVDGDGCILDFIDGYFYLQTALTNTMRKHSRIEYEGVEYGHSVYSAWGIDV